LKIPVKLRRFLHEYAPIPYLEINCDCPEKGGEGNTPLEECMECERFIGMGDNNKFKAFIWCSTSGSKIAKKEKKHYNTKEREPKRDSETVKIDRRKKKGE
jgi:hypothetical protein